MTINLLDIIIIIPLLWFGYNGYKKGLIIELATLAAFILGLYFAFFFSDFTAELLQKYFTIDQKYMAAISFIVTFIAILFIVLAIGKILEKLINVLLLGFLNKLAGGLFGILKGALFLSIIIFIINYFDPNHHIIKKDAIKKSVFYQPVEAVAPVLYSWLNLNNLNFKIPDKDEVVKKIMS